MSSCDTGSPDDKQSLKYLLTGIFKEKFAALTLGDLEESNNAPANVLVGTALHVT